ncbi:MAG: DUF4403 family protein [Bacteroidota bacterium]
MVPPDSSPSSLFLPVFLTWEEAQKRAREQLVGRVLAHKQLQVVVEQVFVHAAQQKIWIRLLTSGSYRGEVRIGLRAYFDPQAYAIHFPEPSLELHTKNLFQKGAALLFKGMLQHQLEKALDVDLRERLEYLTQLANQQLDPLEPLPGVQLRGTIATFQLLEFHYDERGLHLALSATGQLALTLGNSSPVADDGPT